MNVSNNPSNFFEANKLIFNTWFESWLISYVPKLMDHPKWFDNDKDLKKGDVVLFLKSEKELNNDYQYGMVDAVHLGVDGKIRSVEIKYRNHNEQMDRFTHRATRQLTVIHAVDEIDFIKELGDIATFVDMKLKLQHQ